MNLLIKHGEKIATGLILLCCLGLLVGELAGERSQDINELHKIEKELQVSLQENPVKPDWEFAPQQQVAFAERVRQSQGRPAEPFYGRPDDFAYYPQPSRPHVDPKLLLPPEKPPERTDTAFVKAPEELTAKPEQGTVWISCKVTPALARYFKVVRVEFFKGRAADKITEKLGARSLEQGGPEAAPTPAVVPEKKVPELPPDFNKMGKREREAWLKEHGLKSVEEAVAPQPGEKKEVPAEFQNLVPWPDPAVEPKTAYFYKARLVAEQAPVAELKVVWPEGLERLEEKDAEGKVRILYGGPWSAVATTTTPANFTVRFAGVNGQLPDAAKPLEVAKAEYGGRFEIQAWIPKKGDWETEYISVNAGAPLCGSIKWRKKDNSASGDFDFKTDLILDRIEKVVEELKQTVKEPKKDAEGKTVRDEQGKEVMVEREIVRPVTTEVAVFRHAASGAEERYPKQTKPEGRKEAHSYLEKIHQEQEAAEKERLQKAKAALERRAQEKGTGQPK